ncbi:hypothetical protein A2Z33_02820 [Candidatus Gottesmanbacteria bacterium RBG_16_52_11]|uniref:Uncharacterized protein n=1 Tax=Candidatus Gottesmanbacteria bacterium RBG_16_52_11 TaxID=1798374 RepID=A0A1F5YN20_9BACT|nr:MAG: hypothetical protein A2Z33_02820 [Candidatus Gottesmanbacteria bacterium RBG_16_52_11]
MKSHRQTEILNLSVLILILAVGAFCYFSVRQFPDLRFLVGAVTVAAYVIWGAIHHAVLRTLYPKVVVEYLLIGIIAMLLLVISGGLGNFL